MFVLLSTDAAATGSGTGGLFGMLAIYAVFIVILYFILIRPQRKRQKQTTAMQNAITNGDWVLLNDGMYGKVVNVVNECLMVEFGTNRSIIIPVRRDQILSAQEPDLTQKKIEDVEPEPQDDLVGGDLEEDGLDDYDKYLLEEADKKSSKKSPFKKKK
ncbi:preprotein translocase subunit YajC [Bianquea renquensis]|uniref:Preprotein translocase subunit YajC n=1 Tax=Bianquea renquensis TaxID=2763661 RepID=A0A926DRH0_9FIRM|nr:preprotein translocase subunit YajC [Bianquea renquensis]MBC8541965.1 preprotein translocase subunit YajC [Bianquea renquensis]